MSIGPWQLLLVVLLVLIVFGAGKLPRVMGDIGKGVHSLKRGLKEGQGDDAGAAEHPQAAPKLPDDKTT